MVLTYVPKKAAELTYYLFDRKLPPELFNIFRSKRIEQKNFNADLWIIGASHVLRVEGPSKALTEVVASLGNIVPGEGLVKSGQPWEDDLHVAKDEGRLRYRASSKKLMFGDFSDYEEKHREIEEQGREGLFFSFLSAPKQKLAPFTAVTIDGASHFSVETVHAFPAEQTLIYTQTRVDLTDGVSG